MGVMANRSLVLVPATALTLLVATSALAQPGAPPPSQGNAPRAESAPAPAQGGNANQVAPASSQGREGSSSQPSGQPSPSSPPSQPSRPMAGYSFGNGKASTPAHTAHRARPQGPVVSFPAFAEGENGDSHLTVQLSAAVPFEQQVGAGFIVYRLKGARVLRSNDTNPLVAVHFNTPLATAKLRNVGKDVELRVELRAQVAPSAHVEALPSAEPATPQPSQPEGKHKGARGRVAKRTEPVATSQLVIHFPAGNYLETETLLK